MSTRRLILGFTLSGLCLAVPTAADAAVYCVGAPPGCSGTATTLSGAISSATGAGSPEDDTIVLGSGTFSAADLQVNTNPNGSLLIVGQGSTGGAASVLTRTTAEAGPRIDDADTTLRGVRVVIPDSLSFDRGLTLYRGVADQVAVVDGASDFANAGVIIGEGAVLQASSVALSGGNSIGVESFPTGDATVRDSVLGACTGVLGHTPGTMTVERTGANGTTAFASLSGSMVVDSSAATLVDSAGCTSPFHTAAELVGDGSSARALTLRNVTAVAKTPGFRGVRLRRDSGAAAMTADVHSSVFADVDDTLLISAGSAPDPTATFSASAIDPAGSASEAGTGADPNFDDPVRGFADQGGGDYRLLHGSALIDRGEAAAGGSATDLAGLARVVDGKPGVNGATARRDIGAYEYQPGLPTVAAGADPSTATTGQAVTFSATGSSGDPGEGVSYHWSFSDGTSADGATVQKPFATAGGKTATVTATDDSGFTATAGAAVTITDPPAAPAASGGDGTQAPSGGAGGASAGGSGGGGSGPAGGPVVLRIGFVGSASRLDRRGRAPVRLTCPADAAGGCAGTLVIDTGSRVRVGRKRKVARLGSTRFTLAPGQTGTVPVRFSTLGRRLAGARRGVKVHAVATAKDDIGSRGRIARNLVVKRRR
jgi:hypothetical protein